MGTPKFYTPTFLTFLMVLASTAGAQHVVKVPVEARGSSDAERKAILDANDIRTEIWNYGMVGNYPPDPLNIDLSTFHSLEVPKGSGVNYSSGMTPFVLARIDPGNGTDLYLMETGYRERQQQRANGQMMRFEPRPGYIQADNSINKALSIALSSDPATWPNSWPDKDSTWNGAWDGYFGKNVFRAALESYFVFDDNFYDAWPGYVPDSNDHTRRGLGLRISARSFQWSTYPLSDIIFWQYDVLNEGTVNYTANPIFGFYEDVDVGGYAVSCDSIAETDDDNAFYDTGGVVNLAYMWDDYGHGNSLAGGCAPTGYIGYVLLQTPRKDSTASDTTQLGLTGFKMDRLKPGRGNASTAVDNVIFYTDQNDWPHRLYEQFTAAYLDDRFDNAVVSNYDIAFLMASGPFTLASKKTERFAMACVYRADRIEMLDNAINASLFYESGYTSLPASVPERTASAAPQQAMLLECYPNPFNPSTTIKYELPSASLVRLSVYDILGQEVYVLVNESKAAGVYDVKFDGTGLASGLYICKLQAGSLMKAMKLLLLR